MAGVSTEQGENKMNTELNLVPFIDLLSTLTLFLLVTAVWIQVAALPVSVKSKGRSTTPVSEKNTVTIQVTPSGYSLGWPSAISGNSFPKMISRTREGFDRVKLTLVLKNALKTAKLGTAAISGADDVDYGQVVDALDCAKSSGITSVALSP
jgi:biopolymer transport protein ExbD